MKLRFWMRLAIIMAAVSMTPLVLSGVQAVRISTRVAEIKSEQEVRREADNLASYMEAWTVSRADTLSGWFQTWDPDVLALSGEARVGLQRAVYRAMTQAVTVALVDAEWELVAAPEYLTESRGIAAGVAARTWGSPDRAMALLEHLPRAERPDSGVVFGVPYLAPGANIPVIPCVVFREGLELVLVVEMSMADVAGLYAERPGKGLALLDTRGRPIFGGMHRYVDAPRLASLVGTNSNFTDLMFEHKILGATAVVNATGWTAIVVEPAGVSARAGQEIREQVAYFMLLAGLLVAIVGVSMRYSVSLPIEQLRQFANAVAEGDYGRRLLLRRSDELGELAGAFNDMSARLEANRTEISEQREEIEAFNLELQERVEEATAELRDAQQQLVYSGQLAAVAEVGAGLAHDLNNPLAAILGLTQVVRAKYPEAATDSLMERIEEQALRCREVVDAMVRFADGEVDLQVAPVIDIQETLQEVIHLVQGPFRQKGVELRWESVDDSLRVRLDPVLGSRLFAQLLNVFRSGLEDGAVLDVRAARDEDSVRISFSPDRPVAVGAALDDWRASGFELWVAKRLLDQVGGVLEAPEPPDHDWSVILPRA